MKRYVIAAIAGPVAAWAALVLIGGKRADNAGVAILNDPGPVLEFRHGALVGSMVSGVLIAYLTK